jgi:peptide deformylase
LDGILFLDHLTSLKRNMILRKLVKARKVAGEGAL